jgi:hypothetical protein
LQAKSRPEVDVLSLAHLLKGIGSYGYNAARWVTCEFLPTGRNTMSSRVTDLCRLLGVATITLIMVFETRGLAADALGTRWPVWLLDSILAILIGNLVKETTLWLGARLVNAFGADFYRKGVMLDGKAFTEILHPDGTWRRCEFGDSETTCEWTDRFGACYRSVTRQRTPARIS